MSASAVRLLAFVVLAAGAVAHQADAAKDDDSRPPGATKSPATRPDEAPNRWRKLKSTEGIATAKVKSMKFQPRTRAFRVRVECAVRGEPTASRVFASLLCETIRDVEDKPVNWRQIEILHDGKPTPRAVERSFEIGLDEQGKPRWFQIVLTGTNATYMVTVEDEAVSAAGADRKSGDAGKPR